MENVVEVKNLTHYYGNKLVFENFNFEIKSGRIFGLLGKNGTGKTTTINILNGFLKPTSGQCLMFGENSYKLPPLTKARVGFLIVDQTDRKILLLFLSKVEERTLL